MDLCFHWKTIIVLRVYHTLYFSLHLNVHHAALYSNSNGLMVAEPWAYLDLLNKLSEVIFLLQFAARWWSFTTLFLTYFPMSIAQDYCNCLALAWTPEPKPKTRPNSTLNWPRQIVFCRPENEGSMEFTFFFFFFDLTFGVCSLHQIWQIRFVISAGPCMVSLSPLDI